MHQPTFSIITPTLGRSSLKQTLQSLLPQLGPHDQWLIAADGNRPRARQLIDRTGDRRITYFESTNPQSAYGNAQRNAAMKRAGKDFLMFVDDDDWLIPHALDIVRREAKLGVPLMFRMDYRPRNTVLWRTPVLRAGNVGGGMFVTPNQTHRLSAWTVEDDPRSPNYRASDYRFIRQTLAKWPANSLRWCRDVIYCCPRHGHGQ